MLKNWQYYYNLSPIVALNELLAEARAGSPLGQTWYNAFKAAKRTNGTNLATEGSRLWLQIQDALGTFNGQNGLGAYGNQTMPPRNHTITYIDEFGDDQYLTIVLSETNPMSARLWTLDEINAWNTAHPRGVNTNPALIINITPESKKPPIEYPPNTLQPPINTDPTLPIVSTSPNSITELSQKNIVPTIKGDIINQTPYTVPFAGSKLFPVLVGGVILYFLVKK